MALSDGAQSSSEKVPGRGRRHIVLVLGRRDNPMDGVYDYSASLARACGPLGSSVDILEAGWTNSGWLRGAGRLAKELRRRTPCWAVFQVTHLAWSRRGFPFGLLIVVLAARLSGARIAAIVHDPLGFPGDTLISRVKRASQHFVLRFLHRIASYVFVTVPPECVPWIESSSNRHLIFLPVGSNIPVQVDATRRNASIAFSVVVFGVTEGPHGVEQRRAMTEVLRKAAKAVGSVKLYAFGRGTNLTDGAWPKIDGQVEIHALGILDGVGASKVLSQADVMLFVRGGISSRRGSAVAGIAHGLPVVAYRDSETGWPITEAGVVLVDPGDDESLATAVVRIATDSSYRNELRARSSNAYLRYFAWDVIARTFMETLVYTQ